MSEFNEIEFYNKYRGKITCAYEKDIKVDKEGKERCFAKRTQEREKYLFNGLTDDMVLLECPLDMLVIEFETHNNKQEEERKEVDKEKLKCWVAETSNNCEDHNLNYTHVSHGGTSDYIYICNIQNLIENKEKECKKELAKLIIPEEAIDFLDLSNLGKTLVPIINRPHWKKKKYNGTIHKIIDGKNPDKHKNKLPDIILQRCLDNERPSFTKIKDYGSDDINSISLTSVISTAGLKKRGNEYQGENVWHGSQTGMNFVVNPSKNVWHCFRCGCGGGVVQAIALNKGIIQRCDDKLSTEQFKEVLKVAREEYGLKKPEPKKEEEKIEPKKDKAKEENKIKIYLDGEYDRNISDVCNDISKILEDKNILFYRPNFNHIVEVGKIKLHNTEEEIYTGFRVIKDRRFITLVEKYAVVGEMAKGKFGDYFSVRSLSSNKAGVILSSEILEQSLPQIERIFHVPLPIIYEGKLTFPKKGFDKRFNSWMPFNSPEIENLEMSLEEAKEIIEKIYSEFPFKTGQDKTNAVAGLLTPFIRGLFKTFNTITPGFGYWANRERAGKDYCAGINGITFEGFAMEDNPISTGEKKGNDNDELRKKITSAIMSGRKRMHFANNKGHINNAILEQLLTSNFWTDRILGSNDEIKIPRELDISLSGNVGITITPDLVSRLLNINLHLEMENANARKFNNPMLHEWILENRGGVLSALFCLVKNWVKEGSPNGIVAFASYPEWAKICGGIMETAGYNSPCMNDQEGLSIVGDSETADMKQLFEVCFEHFPNRPVRKSSIISLINEEEIFSYFDFDKKQDQTKFAITLRKFIGRTLSDINLQIQDKSIRSSRQEYVFSKVVTYGNDRQRLSTIELSGSRKVYSSETIPKVTKGYQKKDNLKGKQEYSKKEQLRFEFSERENKSLNFDDWCKKREEIDIINKNDA